MSAKHKHIVDTLTWFTQMGVDETLAEKPVNHLIKTKPANEAAVQLATKPAVVKAVAPASSPISKEALQSPELLIARAKELAHKASSLEELRHAVSSFDALTICKTATNLVFGDGNPTSDIMLLGEAPGSEEDMQGIPFCGASGQLLEQMLNAIGLYREKNYYITNTVFWRPPGNRKPTPHELAVCLPFVEKLIALIQPKVIILVGSTAISSLLQSKQAITKMRGTFTDYTNEFMENTIPVTPIFHPAYLLRSPGKKRNAWLDFLQLDAFITSEGMTK
jgi:uracil-DNA glycosylase family 4